MYKCKHNTYATLDGAKRAAAALFNTTGIIAGIEEKAPRPLLRFRLTVDHDTPREPVYVFVLLYREGGGLVWRLSGPLGDVCETLPVPVSVAQAKKDARLAYPPGSILRPFASWVGGDSV